jgi:SAM-dependent methyltransferase
VGSGDSLTLARMANEARDDATKARAHPLDWDEKYRKGEIIWDKGAPSPPLKQYLERHSVRGRALVPGCGHGHEVALAMEHRLDVTGLDISPTAVAEARALYPQLAARFVVGDLFDPPKEMRSAFDVVLEHTCLSGLHPTLRADYRRGIDLTVRPGGLLIGVWYINPDLDPGEEGPPFPLDVGDLTALFADGYAIVEDYVPEVAFAARVGRERVRVLRRAG